MASGPRHSILTLFDPLSASVSNTHTDDSDKENVGPPRAVSPLDTFLQSLHEPTHAAHRLPKKRLVDIGDMTLEDASLPLLQDEAPDDDFASDLALGDDDENSTLTFKDMAKAASPSPKARITIPRTPLGDLPIEDRSILAYKSPASVRSPVFVRDTRAVRRNIDGDQHESPVFRPNSEIPINISPPSPSSSSLSSTTMYSNADSLRPRQAQSPNTNNRLSIDLHTSFQLHLQSPEVTFDLLNDKISFLNSKDGMDSFLESLGEDDDFDMELHKVVNPVEPETQTRDHDAPPQQHGETLQIDNEETSSYPEYFAKDADHMESSASQMTNIGSALSTTSNPTLLDSTGDVAPLLPSVSALKIVKRPVVARGVQLGSGAAVRPTHSSQVSRQPPPIRPTLDATIASEKHVPSSQAPVKRVASQPTAKTSFQPRRDVGPRRILVSQTQPSLTSSSLSQSKGALDCSSGLSKGPRRIPVAPPACKGTGTDALPKSAQNPIPSNPAVTTGLPKPTLKTGIPRFASGPHAGVGRSVNTKKSAIPARRVL